ncbi:hypothetical protein [Nostoc sp. 'Peltigera malacea cyanobiont' DB3992]|uniref:hypothetical protein n=1 Tax=Nostoc sp. 'Peltigera malacea cyanobiont' DB3992 TaxID=1206980 RepID=UPI000C0563B9|nr:hypothetical protein [Nostoc sp. 'Peltigera malacea cyanobiont' DB3992]PHM05823.1 hypothetical protein CK516_38120 [Nostoc sp. 'Peltigera malacea cyanobiont' DB3992]
MQQKFTDQKTELLTQAKSELEQTRQGLLKEMQESVATERSQWQTSLQTPKRCFFARGGRSHYAAITSNRAAGVNRFGRV